MSQIYALLSVKFSGLKMCECKKNDKYEVWLLACDMVLECVLVLSCVMVVTRVT